MEGEQNLRRTAVLGALASVAIVAGIIVAVWLIFFRKPDTNTSKSNSGNSSQQQEAQADNGSKSGSGDSDQTSTTNPKTANNDANGSSSGASNGAQPGKSGDQLANSGPGDVVAIFAAATAVGAGGYYVVTRKRLARN